MKLHRLICTAVSNALLVITCLPGATQVAPTTSIPPAAPTTSTPPAVPSQSLPVSTQIKKTVVFLETDCLHDFEPDVRNAVSTLTTMTPQQVAVLKQQLTALLMPLQQVKQSTAKLTQDEVASLKPEAFLSLDPQHLGNLVIKMSRLTSDDIAKLTPQEIALLTADVHMGTGFIVGVQDDRLPTPPGTAPGSSTAFGYLVTNRHVAQPGVEGGKPCVVLNYSAMLNRKSSSTNNSPQAEMLRLGPNVAWHYSSDDSVDLAICDFSPPSDVYDYFQIAESSFVTRELIDSRKVVEGDPIMFSGLFIQSFLQIHTLEPIVRSGTLALLPNGLMETTLHKPGRIYFAEAHAFHGNSGSPVFIDTSKFANMIRFNYVLLGVVSGEVVENADMQLRISTTYTGNVDANSDISIVVPVSLVRDILHSPALQAERDAWVARRQRILTS
jgi:hypothetical protein